MTKTSHLFSAKGKKGLTDDHLWFSVYGRPVHSPFTRLQRLSCCLCILFTAMLANAMFYDKIDKSNTSSSIQIGSFTLSGQQVIYRYTVSTLLLLLSI